MTSRQSITTDSATGREITRRAPRSQVGEVTAGLRAWSAGSYPAEAQGVGKVGGWGADLLLRV